MIQIPLDCLQEVEQFATNSCRVDVLWTLSMEFLILPFRIIASKLSTVITTVYLSYPFQNDTPSQFQELSTLATEDPRSLKLGSVIITLSFP